MKTKNAFFLLKETTVWTQSGIPNHVYVFDIKPTTRKVNAIGYIRQGTDKFYKFLEPLSIDMRNRTFVVVGKTKWSME